MICQHDTESSDETHGSALQGDDVLQRLRVKSVRLRTEPCVPAFLLLTKHHRQRNGSARVTACVAELAPGCIGSREVAMHE